MDDSNSEPDLEQLRHEVMERRSLSFLSDSQLESLHGHVRKLKARHLEAEEYLEARDASELMEYCRTEIQFRRGQPVPPGTDRDPQATTARRALTKYEQRINEHDEQLNQKLAQLEAKHEQELNRFETQWRDVMPDRYRKPSKLLLQMRYTIQNLAQSEYFGEAQARKEEADNLARQEMAAAQLRLNQDYQAAKRRLLAKHQEEISQIVDQAQRQRALLLTKKTATQWAIGNRQMVLETKPMFKKKTPIRAGAVAGPAPRKSQRVNSEAQRLPPLKPPNAPPGLDALNQRPIEPKPTDQAEGGKRPSQTQENEEPQ
jgi:hypothetical protein